MKNLVLKTKRLTLTPMSEEQLVSLINITDDEHLKHAYGEMLDGARKYPDKENWYISWAIFLKNTDIMVGDLCFKGEPNENGEVEIGYGINNEYQGKGFATEAVRAVCDWAYSQPKCYYVQAQTEPDNIASQKVLQKNDFTRIGDGEEGFLFEKEKPTTSWMAIFMCLGLSIGTSLDQLFSVQYLSGMSIGMLTGIAIGAALDAQEKKKRKKKK